MMVGIPPSTFCRLPRLSRRPNVGPRFNGGDLRFCGPLQRFRGTRLMVRITAEVDTVRLARKEHVMATLDESAIARSETRHEPATHPPRSSRGAMVWDDVRVFLAIARKGSMRAAGRALGLSQPTIARRLAAFEATSGGPGVWEKKVGRASKILYKDPPA